MCQVGFPAGLILDSVGPVVTTALAAVVEVAGLSIIALCDADGEVISPASLASQQRLQRWRQAGSAAGST